MNWATKYGDEELATKNEILRTVVGSGVHGIAIEGTDDHDEMGIYVAPVEHLLGVREYRDDFTARTQPEGARSGPGDTDLIIYSLRKYLKLALKGNPTALLPLYAPEESLLRVTELGSQLRDIRGLFLSRNAVERFLGYMVAQHERMMGGGRRSRVPTRPELIEKYGWDVKYGSHALRLAYQGREIATTGYLSLPLVELERQRILAIKRGEVAQIDVGEEIADIEDNVRRLIRDNQLAVPEKADIATIQAWAIDAHVYMWNTQK